MFIFLSVLVLSLSFLNNASASALTPLVQLTDGSTARKAVLGIMEQSGMKTATRNAKDIATERWRMNAYNQYLEDNATGKNNDLWAQINSIDSTLNNAEITPIPDKPGFGKILVDTSLYLSVFMLSYDVTSSLVDAYQNQQDLEFLDDEIKKQEGVSKYFQVYNYKIEKIEDASPYFNRLFLYDYQLDDTKLTVAGWGSSAIDYLTEAYITDWGITSDNKLILYVYARYYWSGKWQIYNLTYTRPYLPDFGFTKFANKPLEVPTLEPPEVFQPYTQPDANPNIKPEGMPEQMEVIIPLDDSGLDSPVPWNEPYSPSEPDAPPVEPADAPEHSDWWEWLLSPLAKILEWLQKIWEAIKALVGELIAGLVSIFVPSEGYFEDLFKDIKAKFDLKLPLISQLTSFFIDIKDATFNSSIPTFEIRVPDDWGGGVYSIIDFKYFTDYRVWILNFIRFTAWYFFLKRVYNRIPSVVY
jgi:hypothetical protein